MKSHEFLPEAHLTDLLAQPKPAVAKRRKKVKEGWFGLGKKEYIPPKKEYIPPAWFSKLKQRDKTAFLGYITNSNTFSGAARNEYIHEIESIYQRAAEIYELVGPHYVEEQFDDEYEIYGTYEDAAQSLISQGFDPAEVIEIYKQKAK